MPRRRLCQTDRSVLLWRSPDMDDLAHNHDEKKNKKATLHTNEHGRFDIGDQWMSVGHAPQRFADCRDEQEERRNTEKDRLEV